MKVKPLNEGEKIPQFSTKDETGVIHSNQTIKGQLTLIYFYPRDNTPGCTTQACDIRDSYDELLKVPVHILALSLVRRFPIKNLNQNSHYPSRYYWMKTIKLRNLSEFGEKRNLWERLLTEFIGQVI